MRINYHFRVQKQMLMLEKYEPAQEGPGVASHEWLDPVVGDKNCIWAVFHVDYSWAQDQSVKAIFKKDALSILMELSVRDETTLECQIPWEMLQTEEDFFVGLHTNAGINSTQACVRPRYACQYEGRPNGLSVEDWISHVDRVTKEAVDTANAVKQAAESGQFDGADGMDGDSAYQLAVKHGFQGTEDQWLEHLAYDHSDEFTVLAQQVAADARQAKQNADRANREAIAAEKSAERAEAAAGSTEQALDERDVAIVNQLAPPFHQTAPMVQGTFVTGHPLGVVSHIRPVQDGEGDPSPENVRPIHGHRELTLTKCGKNLLDKANALALVTNTDGVVEQIGSYVGFAFWVGKHATVSISGDFKLLNSGLVRFGTFRSFPRAGLQGVRTDIRSENSKNINTGDYDYILLGLNPAPGKTMDDVLSSFTLALGAPIPFAPYTGETYTQKLPEEVFGGVLDWQRGELGTVWKTKTFTSTDGWRMVPTGRPGSNRYNITVKDAADAYIGKGEAVCTKLKLGEYGGTYSDSGVFTIADGVLFVRFVDGMTTLDDLLKYMPFTIAYPATDSPTVQLETLNLVSLSGATTLYSSTGDTEVVGRLDPNAVISGLMDRVAALEQFHTQM